MSKTPHTKRAQGRHKSKERSELKQAFHHSHHHASKRGIAIIRAQENGDKAEW